MNYFSTEKHFNKVLFVRLSKSGKTSIIQVVFEGLLPESTIQNQATGRISKKRIDFSGKIISIFEVGGQISFLDESISNFKESIYSDVKNLIFVVDSSHHSKFSKANYYYKKACSLALEYNKDVNILLFAHKIDLVAEEEQSEILKEIKSVFEVGLTFNSIMYPTSIYEDNIFDVLNGIKV